MKIDIGSDVPRLYVKLELGSGRGWGEASRPVQSGEVLIMERRLNEEAAGDSQDSGFTCPDCGGHSFTTVQHNDAFEYGAGDSPVTLHARVPVHCCDSCDFEFLGREGRLIKHEAVCRHLGLLTPTEIRSIRDSPGMSRTAFAEVTGFGEATLDRWENGVVIQNQEDNHYLRLLESPGILRSLNDP